MEKNVVEQFLGKNVVEEAIIVFTDRLGAMLLEDIVSIVEFKPGRNNF